MKDNERIPPVPGPTLGPFQHPLKDRLELLDLLSDPDSEGAASGNGGHGHVFRARFGKEIFAIKIVSLIQDLVNSGTRRCVGPDAKILVQVFPHSRA